MKDRKKDEEVERLSNREWKKMICDGTRRYGLNWNFCAACTVCCVYVPSFLQFSSISKLNPAPSCHSVFLPEQGEVCLSTTPTEMETAGERWENRLAETYTSLRKRLGYRNEMKVNTCNDGSVSYMRLRLVSLLKILLINLFCEIRFIPRCFKAVYSDVHINTPWY